MSPNWVQNLKFFLDPQLKVFDKEFYREVVQDFESLALDWCENLDELTQDENLPNIFLLLSDTSTEPSVRESDHVLLFGSSNMSLFGKKEFEGVVRNINETADWKDFLESVSSLFANSFHKALNSLVSDSQKNLKKLSRVVSKSNMDRIEDQIQEVEAELFGQPSFYQSVESAQRIAKDFLGIEVSLLQAPSAYKSHKNILLAGMLDGNPIFLCWSYHDKELETLWFFSLIEDLLEAASIKLKKETSLEDLQIILSDLPVALALFNKKDELILHNPMFFQLNLSSKQCLGLENGEQFTQSGELYRAQIIELEKQDSRLFYFIPIKEFLGESSSPSSEELGIITSSIAHELNNPLGGISGALDVILLDEHSSDIEQRLHEMKAGVARCKKLVETFLGFSKLHAASVSKDESYSIRACMDSAVDLIRFRLIENNIKLEASFSTERMVSFNYNPHVLSMTLYLMLGDLLTNFGHQKLVANDRSATFDFEVVERETSLEIKTKGSLKLGEDFLSSKLLNHLLDIQGLSVETRPHSVFLKSL
ncbi:MAG: hypothetical protein CMJ16_10065 [Peredibacter sp.]|nr:hypothetical protein [Peredibacter sp.]|tara:strand:+ start:3510 stop:5120 length:1611 start_codon:yes stop_codon:yes gene_type:complete